MLLASCFLDGEARQWWLYLCNGHERPRGIDDFGSFVQALLGRFMPRSAREQALGELRKLKQGKLSIDRYIEKYQSLVQKSHNVDPELQYQWFIAGLNPGDRQALTAWTADKDMKGEVVGLDTMVQFLRMERRNATATALANKGKLLGGATQIWNLWMSKRWPHEPPCDAGKTEERRQHEGPLPAGHETTHNSGNASFAAKRGT